MKTFNLCIVLLITSCSSYRYIDIHVLNPGYVKLPSDITLHIIDPKKIENDHFLSFRDSTTNKLLYYKLLLHTFDSTLKARLSESPMFEKSKIFIQNEIDFQEEMLHLTSVQKTKHIRMSIEKMDLIEGKIQGAYDVWNYCHVYSYNFSYKLKLELQNIGNKLCYDTCSILDTLTFTSNSQYEDFLVITSLITLPDAIKEIGFYAANQYAKKVAPLWRAEERMLFYSRNNYMRKGYDLFVANDMEGAIQTWKHLYEVGTPQLASIAAHNIGLMYEMLDDFENSELWLNNSLKSKNHYQTVDYLYRIQERNAGRKKLDEQMIQP